VLGRSRLPLKRVLWPTFLLLLLRQALPTACAGTQSRLVLLLEVVVPVVHLVLVSVVLHEVQDVPVLLGLHGAQQEVLEILGLYGAQVDVLDVLDLLGVQEWVLVLLGCLAVQEDAIDVLGCIAVQENVLGVLGLCEPSPR